jgi:hypothetical protein
VTTAIAIPSAAEALADIEKQVGGRQAIVQALVIAPPSKDVKYVLGLLCDPDIKRRGMSLTEICIEAKITPGHLLDLLERGTKLRARIIAGQIIARGTPAVAEDVMQKAAPYEDACPDCQGTGAITPDPTPDTPNPGHAPCKKCAGQGKLRYEADPDCRKLALEMAGLTAKGGGINIGIQTNVQTTGGGGAGMAYEALTELMDRMVYGRKPALPAAQTEIIDATLADPA